MSVIYFPMTANILTAGHIKCIEWLSRKGTVVIGLLTRGALKGYKQEVVPFKDRFLIMQTIAAFFPDVSVVPQKRLDPRDNVLALKCDAIASGDGWEPVELDFIKRYNIRRIDVKLKGERSKKYSSSKILECLREKKSY